MCPEYLNHGSIKQRLIFIFRRNCFVQKTTHDSRHRYLNTNGPLHVGGISFAKDSFEEFATNALGMTRYTINIFSL